MWIRDGAAQMRTPTAAAFWLCLICLFYSIMASPVDYWSDNFDEEANCKQADLISNELKPKDQCESVETKTDTQAALIECKTRLQRRLQKSCSLTKVKSTGDLLYCKIRTQTQCCFNNHSCVGSWDAINAEFGKESAFPFLQDKEKVLTSVEKTGYKKCYAITGLDVSKCAEDCKQAATEEFAKNCSLTGGFFKCCIRRDKRDCHECRFCCSLPLCTLNTTQGKTDMPSNANNSGIQNRGMAVILEKDQTNEDTAAEKFNVAKRIWKSRDYRCLKPDDSKPSSEWPHYVHEEFKKASSKEELDKVGTIPFDVNFMNMEDPEVLEKFVGPDYQKHWKETYGVDFATKKVWPSVGNQTVLEEIRMSKYCLESEYSSFAKKCRKKGGFYKCCTAGFNLHVFEQLRVDLASQKLVEAPKKRLCPDGEASPDCTIYTATHLCTIKDPLSGTYKTEFETPTQPKYQVGGTPASDPELSGFRTDFCVALPTCLNGAQDFDLSLYEKVSNKETFCSGVRAALEKHQASNVTKKSIDAVDVYCKKQKMSTVVLCENDADLEGVRATSVTKETREMMTTLDEKKQKEKKDRKSDKKKKKKKKKEKKASNKKKDKKKKKT